VSLATGIATGVAMSPLAVRADRSLAPGQASLPMNSAPDGSVLWRAPRRVALWVMPGLAAPVFLLLELLAPDPLGAAISALSLLGGQVVFPWLIGRTA
jgi:hypothetical protein